MFVCNIVDFVCKFVTQKSQSLMLELKFFYDSWQWCQNMELANLSLSDFFLADAKHLRISPTSTAPCAPIFWVCQIWSITGAIGFQKDSSLKINHIRSCAKTFPRSLEYGWSLCAEFLPGGQSFGELSTNDCFIDEFYLLDGSLGAELGRDKGGTQKSELWLRGGGEWSWGGADSWRIASS